MDKSKCVFSQMLEKLDRRLDNAKKYEDNPKYKSIIEDLKREKAFLEEMIRQKNASNR